MIQDTDRSGTIGFSEFAGLWKYIKVRLSSHCDPGRLVVSVTSQRIILFFIVSCCMPISYHLPLMAFISPIYQY